MVDAYVGAHALKQTHAHNTPKDFLMSLWGLCVFYVSGPAPSLRNATRRWPTRCLQEFSPLLNFPFVRPESACS